jgi:chemotaxis methyl-accepting protein methylase
MLNCEICGGEPKGVCSSGLAPYSMAICQECLNAGREPWFILVGVGVPYEALGEAYRPIYDASLAFYKKTPEDLNRAIEKSNREIDALCKEHDEHS